MPPPPTGPLLWLVITWLVILLVRWFVPLGTRTYYMCELYTTAVCLDVLVYVDYSWLVTCFRGFLWARETISCRQILYVCYNSTPYSYDRRTRFDPLTLLTERLLTAQRGLDVPKKYGSPKTYNSMSGGGWSVVILSFGFSRVFVLSCRLQCI